MKKATLRHIIIQFHKISNREAILKSVREKRHIYIYRHAYKDKDDSRFLVGNNVREMRMKQMSLKY